MKLSIVTSLYKSSPHIDALYRRLCDAAQAVTNDFEIVFVNDGSPDDSLARALALHETDKRVTVVDLSRNFGHHKAIITGLAQARGDYVFLIDSDLEEPPEVLPEFFAELQRTDSDVIYGYQVSRKRGAFDRLTGETFYRVFNSISPIQIPPNLLTVRLMTRRYLDSFLAHPEREISLAGLWALTGYRQTGLPVNKIRTNSSAYDFRRRAAIGITSLIAFSSQPLIVCALLGAAISIFSFLFIIYLIIHWMTTNSLSGWTSVIASIWLMGGLIIFFVGLVGIYVSKIFMEVKQRPHAIIREIRRGSDSGQ